MKRSLSALLFVSLLGGPTLFARQAISGEDVYRKNCASCHDQVSARIPTHDALQKMSAARILRTMDFGLMMSIAYPLKRDEREAVAKFLGTSAADAPPPRSAFCAPGVTAMSGSPAGNWTGWSPAPDNTRYQPAARAGLTSAQVPNLKLKWAFGFADDVTAFGSPSVVNGTLFLGSASGAVQALDTKSGCIEWLFQANGPVRSTTVAVQQGNNWSLVFGDQIGWVYSLDAKTGKLNWKKRVEDHEATRLTGAPAVHDGVVFIPAASWEETRAIDPNYRCCTFRGSVTALRARDGSMLWKTYMVDPPAKTGVNKSGVDQLGPSGAGVWSTPTVDARRGLLYVTTGDNYSFPATRTSDSVMALELKTGRIVWSRQTTPNDVYNSACGGGGINCPPGNGPDFDFGSSALMLKTPAGRELLFAGQKSGMVFALDPEREGQIVWQTRVGTGGTNGGVQWGMASDGQQLYAAVSDVVRPPGGIGGAGAIGNANLDPVKGGGLAALRLDDGTKIWSVPGTPCAPQRSGCSPAQPAAVAAIPGAVFSGAMDGHLRAFSATDGKLLWDFDTAKPFTTVNGVRAAGGSLDGAGAVISGGMVFVNSGYPRFGGMPGNVLLAFGN